MENQISMGVIRRESLPTDIVAELLNRDVALWIGRGVGQTKEDAASLGKMVLLPWRLVMCEEDSSTLASTLKELGNQGDRFSKNRGFVDVIASDPEDIQLTPRALPIFFLNGRADAEDSQESNNLSRNAMLRRRLNMVKRLIDTKPRMLVVVSDGDPVTFDAVQELWEEGFRSILTYFTQDEPEIQRITDWTNASLGPPLVQICELARVKFAKYLFDATDKLAQPDRLVIRYRTSEKTIISLDVTGYERTEYPLLNHYDLILERNLHPLLPEELSEQELNSFFERSSDSWKPYAAGLPWIREQMCVKKVLDALDEVARTNYEHNQLLLISAEAGAGGTTFARSLAFEAAKAGFPAFVAKQSKFTPETTELTSFLFRIHQRQFDAISGSSETEVSPQTDYSEIPGLIVFDVHHWAGNERGLQSFMRGLARESRAAVVLAVVDSTSVSELPETKVLDSAITHSLKKDEVLELGYHLNRFLEPKSRGRTPDEWRAFGAYHAPLIGDLSQTTSSFWIALGFWLRRQLNLDTSIQSWLYSQFRSANLTNELRCILLRIAALSLSRHQLAEGLLPTSPKGTYPYSVQLEEARRQIPGLGLCRVVSETSRQWLISHPLLARYVVNATFSDREMVKVLGFEGCTNAVSFQLELLRHTATDKRLGTERYLFLAKDFAVNTLKLDRDGNREFFIEWRRVLDILEEMPERVWDTSRSFNHHVAISRRRVARDETTFMLSDQEKREQLRLAIEHLEYAIEKLEATDEEERDLNILNSLARAYQDLAELEEDLNGNQEEIKQYREKAGVCIRRALQDDPNSSYVLETLARDLIQHSKAYPEESIGKACEALGFIHRALSLESAVSRKEKLMRLLGDCLHILRDERGEDEISRLCAGGNALGFVARAWIELQEGSRDEMSVDFRGMPVPLLDTALTILDEIPEEGHTWLDLELKYGLLSSRSPLDFAQQIAVLDELQGTNVRLDVQRRVEYAILLYQIGRNIEGNNLFWQLRREMQDSSVFVTIPQRLRVLLNPTDKKPLICLATVSEERGYRGRAIVRDFGRGYVPFIPRDFGQAKMPVGTRFRCAISFGTNGPFAKPPS